MDVVSQREMRNNSGDILRRVAAGETLLVTNRGVPAAVLSPPGINARDRLRAAGRLTIGTGLDLPALPPPVRPETGTDDLLAEDRG